MLEAFNTLFSSCKINVKSFSDNNFAKWRFTRYGALSLQSHFQTEYFSVTNYASFSLSPGQRNFCLHVRASAEPTMANNATDIENNMVSIKECITLALTTCLPVSVHWTIIDKEFQLCANWCFFSINSVMTYPVEDLESDYVHFLQKGDECVCVLFIRKVVILWITKVEAKETWACDF